VNSPILDGVSADLQLRRAGAIGLLIDTAKVRADKHFLLNTNIEIKDASGGVLIAGDNSGNIDQLGPILLDERITTYAKNALEPERCTAAYDYGPAGTADYIRVTGNGDMYFFCSEMPSLKNGKSIKLLEVKIGYRTTHLNDHFSDLRAITASTLVQPINDPAIQLFDNELNVGQGATGDAVCTLTGSTTLNAGDIVIIKGVSVITTDIKIYGFSIRYEEV
jgi:hypothetical protein